MLNTKIIIQSFFLSVLLCMLVLLYFMALINIRDILILMIITFGIWPIIRSFITDNRDVLSPKILLPFTYTLYALGPLSLSTDFSQDIFIHYLFLQLVGMLSLRFGLYCGVRNSYMDSKLSLDINKRRKNPLLMTAFGLILLSVPSLLSQLSAFGGLTGLISIGYGGKRYQVLASSFVLGTGFEWLLLGLVIGSIIFCVEI
ncbi:hypothetical protein Anamo_1196 [Acetomicrobium mobile DSM 13181]|uniref:Uncharacterized protein n=1 Tax=Acetomicrobium mobile (strain ATCC BAA-54 / DSM 13181 / JCM 12221 / NGA) TaxID=891968 RepID=I4BX07_ACEMN|nr:hypothetical protein [Acetomicrobium mobile]AFM21814.1 hypothetical protein Anamo_1196 [Acetomicrobium mobile DSM 13181]